MAVPSDKVVARFISARVREMYPVSSAKKKAPGEFTLQAIADDLGITKPQVADALNGTGGVGQKFETQFAKRFYDGSVDALRRAAADWARANPVTDARQVVIEEPTHDALDRVVRREYREDEPTWWPAGMAADAMSRVIVAAKSERAKASDPSVLSEVFWFRRLAELCREERDRARMQPPKLPPRETDIGSDAEVEAEKAQRKASKAKTRRV